MGLSFPALTFLFFAWGFITCLNDILVPHLRGAFDLTYAQGALVQSSFFLAYFIASLPSGAIVGRLGYKRGIIIGLAAMAVGCGLFVPAASLRSFPLFLVALFVLASGITLLQVAANPFVTLLGKPETASARLNLTQAFNSLGTTIAPAIGGTLILAAGTGIDSVKLPYTALAGMLAALAVLFAAIPLPRPTDANEPLSLAAAKSALKHKNLVFGIGGIFVYVGAEVAIGSFLVNYIMTTLHPAGGEQQAAYYVSFYWGGAMIGRFLGSALMRWVSPGRLLTAAACGSMALIATALLTSGATSVYALLAVGLCNSIMFPTIFSLGVRNLGPHTSVGSSLLIMAIVGGAVVPLLTGFGADHFGLKTALLLPAACYLYIAAFGWLNGEKSPAASADARPDDDGLVRAAALASTTRPSH